MSFKWSIYCVTEANGVDTWSNIQPTMCPNNPAHTIGSVSQTNQEIEFLRLRPSNSVINRSSYSKILSFIYRPILQGTLRRILLLASMSGIGTTSCTFNVYNLTTVELISSLAFDDFTANTIIDLGVITSPPTEDCVIEIDVKRDNGNAQITIEEIVLYGYQ